MNRVHMRDLFAADPERFKHFSVKLGDDLLFDYSKNILKPKTLQLLLQLADETGVANAIEQLFTGVAINETENRPVLHTALRNFSGNVVEV